MERVIVDKSKRKMNEGESADEDELNEEDEDIGENPCDRVVSKVPPAKKKRASKKNPGNVSSQAADKSHSQASLLNPSSQVQEFQDVTFLQDATDIFEFSDVPMASASDTRSSSESSLSKLINVFSEPKPDDKKFENANKCVAHIGHSLMSG